MRIAFLCKRHYMSKDVILDRYARLYEIPYQLARLGHDVRGYCLSYRGRDDGEWEHDAAPGRLHWESRSIGGWRLPALVGYPRHLSQRLRKFRPDAIIGASDIPHVALGARLAKRLRVPYAVDLYDNFEGFGQARIPGFVSTFRRAVRDADLVTTTSEPLRDLIIDQYHARGKVVAMPSTVDHAVFHRTDRADCRRALGLPVDAQLVGTAGGLLETRGIGVLYAAWQRMVETHPRAHLVLAGPADRGLPPPARERVHYLGMLAHADTATLFNALDVGVIYLRDTPFGRYCFPQKLYEMIACELPIVAADVGVMPHLLASTPACTYRADDPDDCTRAIAAQLDRPVQTEVKVESWSEVIAKLELDLRQLTKPRTD
ncbi:MAG: glycosyltransferase family 4 protein [Rhodanobacteraceae bacterium]